MFILALKISIHPKNDPKALLANPPVIICVIIYLHLQGRNLDKYTFYVFTVLPEYTKFNQCISCLENSKHGKHRHAHDYRCNHTAGAADS